MGLISGEVVRAKAPSTRLPARIWLIIPRPCPQARSSLPSYRPNRSGVWGRPMGLSDCTMIRTMWLTIACLAVLASLLVGKALKTPVALAAVTPIDETTIGTGSAQDPLTKADRLEFARVRPEVPAQPLIAPVPASVPPVETKIVSRDWHDPDATASLAGKSKQPKRMAAGKKRKSVDAKGSRIADRSRSARHAKPCYRNGAFGDLMKSLKLSPACIS
jgi:hypothetical protein